MFAPSLRFTRFYGVYSVLRKQVRIFYRRIKILRELYRHTVSPLPPHTGLHPTPSPPRPPRKKEGKRFFNIYRKTQNFALNVNGRLILSPWKENFSTRRAFLVQNSQSNIRMQLCVPFACGLDRLGSRGYWAIWLRRCSRKWNKHRASCPSSLQMSTNWFFRVNGHLNDFCTVSRWFMENIEICRLFQKTYFAFLSTVVIPLQNIK